MEDVIKVNEHLVREDFGRIFGIDNTDYMWNQWCYCNKVEGVFRLWLSATEEMMWDKAITGQVQGIEVSKTLFYN